MKASRVVEVCLHAFLTSSLMVCFMSLLLYPQRRSLYSTHAFMAYCLLKYRHIRTFSARAPASNPLDRRSGRPQCGKAKYRTTHCVCVICLCNQIYVARSDLKQYMYTCSILMSRITLHAKSKKGHIWKVYCSVEYTQYCLLPMLIIRIRILSNMY
jgi:hypothetical protein